MCLGKCLQATVSLYRNLSIPLILSSCIPTFLSCTGKPTERHVRSSAMSQSRKKFPTLHPTPATTRSCSMVFCATTSETGQSPWTATVQPFLGTRRQHPRISAFLNFAPWSIPRISMAWFCVHNSSLSTTSGATTSKTSYACADRMAQKRAFFSIFPSWRAMNVDRLQK